MEKTPFELRTDALAQRVVKNLERRKKRLQRR